MISKLKIIMTNIAKKNFIFRKILRKCIYIYKLIRFKIRGLGQKVDDKCMVFCTFNGKSFSDSPKAIYSVMVNDEKYKDYKFIWGFKNPENYKFLEENRNTVVTKTETKEYEKYLKKAKYWIFNYRAQDHQYPKKNQVFVQCWHGTPLKRLGYDIINSDNVMNTQKEIEHKYKVDAKKFKYMISPSKFTTEKLISAWNLKAVNKEDCVIEEGYPRNDFLYNYTQEDIDRIKENLKIKNINKKIILYAPTWRDNQHEAGVGYTYKTQVDFDKLQKELSQDYIILFRAHYLVANEFDFEKYKGFIYNVSKYDDINELYVVADMLITDYSSVFFDYANLKRPIIYYMYDLDKYKNNMRGFYLGIEELPGNIVKTEDDLINEIKSVSSNFKYTEKYKEFNERFNYLDDGQASKRVINKLLK